MESYEWQYNPARDLDQKLLDRLRSFPRQPDMLVYSLRSVSILLIRGWLKLYHRIKIIGMEQLPTAGSYVLVANHASHLDALSLITMLPLAQTHRVFPAAAEDYFFRTPTRTFFSAIVVNALPFGRVAHKRESLSVCAALLQNPGNILILFPEGGRSLTGKMDEFKLGIGLLVAGTNIPVIPCYIEGAFKCWPKGAYFPRPGRVRVTIGTPCTYRDFLPGTESALQISRELRQAVLELEQASRFRVAQRRLS